MDEFAYFMIRIRQPSRGTTDPAIDGIVERLDTGEKRPFRGADELLRVMCVHPHGPDATNHSTNMKMPDARNKPE